MRVLILTAGFGEGHNTAARNIAEALRETPGTEALVDDVYIETMPQFTKVLQAGYGLAINKFPSVWSTIFNLLDKPGGLERTLPLGGNLRRALQRRLEEFRPDVIVSTYPLYPFLVRELRSRGLKTASVPLLTVITDSTAINSSWYRGGSEAFLLADEETGGVLRRAGVDPSLLRVVGFPVAPRLASLKPLEPVIHGAFRILYLPSSRIGHTLGVVRALGALSGIEITVVTGRFQALHRALASSGLVDGVRVHLVGWTDKVPELLCSHHLYIGKAGGAIVHEAMAAQCPILISHVVPGQEEGNIELIERRNIGRLAAHYPVALAASVSEILSHYAATWKTWKRNLEAISRPSATREIASCILRAASAGR
jgi:processive 1,2-diacylglycerol beta-glucosyltransferase